MESETPKNGLHVEHYDNGQLKSEFNYKDGDLDGKSTFWYENGHVEAEMNYKNNKKEGKWSEWHEDGQKKLEANYKDNMQDGEMTNWDADGDVIGYRFFKEGELVWSNNSDKNIDFNILALQGGSLAMTDEEVAETCDTFPNELLHTPFMNLWLTWYYFLSNLEAEDNDSDVPFQALEKQFNKLKNIIPSEHWIEISKEYYPDLTSDWWMDEGKLLSACKFCYSKHTPDSL
jgi:hypothetical protein